MARFRTCPKCRGDLMVDRDQHGWYEECIICGYLRDLGSKGQVPQESAPGTQTHEDSDVWRADSNDVFETEDPDRLALQSALAGKKR